MSSAISRSNPLVWGNAGKAMRLLGGMIALFLFCLPLLSQSSQGTIQGGVFDQSGGAIVGAAVTVTDVARGNNRIMPCTKQSPGGIDLCANTLTARASL
jgi:hypothetical protein